MNYLPTSIILLSLFTAGCTAVTEGAGGPGTDTDASSGTDGGTSTTGATTGADASSGGSTSASSDSGGSGSTGHPGTTGGATTTDDSSGTGGTGGCNPGGEGCPCVGGECLGDLVCASDLCVDLPGSTGDDTTGGSTGGDPSTCKDPCNSNADCTDAGSVCLDSEEGNLCLPSQCYTCWANGMLCTYDPEDKCMFYYCS